MKLNIYTKILLLILYAVGLFSLYAWLAFPVLLPPKGLTETNIPSLSISGLNEASELFTKRDKEAVGKPSEPDISKYSYGQPDPFKANPDKN